MISPMTPFVVVDNQMSITNHICLDTLHYAAIIHAGYMCFLYTLTPHSYTTAISTTFFELLTLARACAARVIV